MYNEKQKREYIEYCLASSNVKDVSKYKSNLIAFFSRLGKEVESDFEKDFCMFDYSDMKIALATFCKKTSVYQRTSLSRLRSYLNWCIDFGLALDQENRLDGIVASNIDTTISCKMNMVSSEDQLIERMDAVLQPMAHGTIDNMYRVCYLLIFSGIKLDDTVKIKSSDVDFENKTITFNGRTVGISDYTSQAIAALSNMNCYVAASGPSGERLMDIVKTGYVLERTVAGREGMVNSMTTKISNHFKDIKDKFGFKISITVNSLLLSGVFSRMLQKEKCTGNIDFLEYVILFVDGKKLNASKTNLTFAMEDYCTWKKTFVS